MKNDEKILSFRKRKTEVISLAIPTDTLASIREIANARDMTEDALLKLYIGNGLRQDVAKLFAEHVLDVTQKVLSKHLQSEEQIAEIMKEIRGDKEAA